MLHCSRPVYQQWPCPLLKAIIQYSIFKGDESGSLVLEYRSVEVYRVFCSYLRLIIRIWRTILLLLVIVLYCLFDNFSDASLSDVDDLSLSQNSLTDRVLSDVGSVLHLLTGVDVLITS